MKMPETLTWSTVGLILYDFCIRSFLIFVLPARAQEPSPVNAENGYGYYWSSQVALLKQVSIIRSNWLRVQMVVLTTRVSEVTLLRQSRAPVHQWWPLLTLIKNLPILNRPIGRIVIPGLRNWEKVTFLKHWSTKKERLSRLVSCRLCRNILM